MSIAPSLVDDPWVRVVIVAYNAHAWLQRVVDGLACQIDPAFEVVIVDNASTDESISALRLPDQRFRVLMAGSNLGFAAGSNLGAKGAATPFLAMLNPDAVPEPGWLAALRAATRRYPTIAMFGSTQLAADKPECLDGAGDLYSACGIAWRGGFGAPAESVDGDLVPFAPCAAAALYLRDVFEAAGGFAEGFFCYLEDVELGFRLRLSGHSAVQVADARVLHAGSAVTGRHSPFTLYHSTRNGVYTLVRCMPLALLLVCLPLYVLAQLWLCRRVPGSGKTRLKGLRDGLCAVPMLWKQRGPIQRGRRLGILAVAGLLVWDPRALSRRAMPPRTSGLRSNRDGRESMGHIAVQDFVAGTTPVEQVEGVQIYRLAEEASADPASIGVGEQFLGNAAEYVAKYTNPAHFIDIYRRALAQIRLPERPEGTRVLDIGVGGGNSAYALFTLIEGVTVLGVDVSLPLLRLCAHAAADFYVGGDRLALLEADLTQLAPVPGSVDLVTGASILHHLTDPAHIVETVLTALRPGGSAIFFEPFEDGHGILRGIYAAILAAEPHHDEAIPDALRGHMIAYVRDFDARKGVEIVRSYTQFLDDKWVFTKGWFEALAKRCRCTSVRFIPTHSHQQIFWRQFVVQAQLDNGSGADGLPQWGKAIFTAFDDSFSAVQLAELCFTGIVVLQR